MHHALMQVFEARRFGADALLGEATLEVGAIPKEGRPKYHWLTLLQPGTEASPPARVALGAGRLHVRVQWTPQAQPPSYKAVDVALQGIGVSMTDSMSTQVVRELAYIHVSDVQLRLRADRPQSDKRAGDSGPRDEISLSIQSIQMDNQLSNAAFPVMLCRRDLNIAGSALETRQNTGMLKAAQRQWEQQAQGPPLVQVQIERLHDSALGSEGDGNVFLKCAPASHACLVRGFRCSSACLTAALACSAFTAVAVR
jgi:hypothetical protein